MSERSRGGPPKLALFAGAITPAVRDACFALLAVMHNRRAAHLTVMVHAEAESFEVSVGKPDASAYVALAYSDVDAEGQLAVDELLAMLIAQQSELITFTFDNVTIKGTGKHRFDFSIRHVKFAM